MVGSIVELQRRIQAKPLILIAIIAAFWIVWGFGYQTFWARLATSIDGTITARQEVSSSGRRGTVYIVRGVDGSNYEYVAGATDASLSRDLPVGTVLVKRKWQLSYLRDGTPVYDFPTYFYAATLGIAVACLSWAGFQLIKRTT